MHDHTVWTTTSTIYICLYSLCVIFSLWQAFHLLIQTGNMQNANKSHIALTLWQTHKHTPHILLGHQSARVPLALQMICEKYTEILCQSWTDKCTHSHAPIHKFKYTKVLAPFPNLFHTHMRTWQNQEADIIDSFSGLKAFSWQRLLEILVQLIVQFLAGPYFVSSCGFINHNIH